MHKDFVKLTWKTEPSVSPIILLCGKNEFEADLASAMLTRRERVVELQRDFMRTAMIQMQNFIDPRFRNQIARPAQGFGGIGSHASIRVVWGTRC